MDDALGISPAIRIKAGREHRVPLPPRAVAILKAQQQEQMDRRLRSDLVFPNDEGSEPSVNVFSALFKRMGIAGISTHGFRSTFRDWAGNETEHAREVMASR